MPVPVPAKMLPMAVWLPLMVRLLEPEPEIVAPELPAVAVNTPDVTLKVSVRLLVPASASAMEMPTPAKELLTCSVTVGSVALAYEIVGASLTDTTVTVRVMAEEFAVLLLELSVTTTEISRDGVVLGLSEVLLNETVRSAVWYVAKLAEPESVNTPPA